MPNWQQQTDLQFHVIALINYLHSDLRRGTSVLHFVGVNVIRTSWLVGWLVWSIG